VRVDRPVIGAVIRNPLHVPALLSSAARGRCRFTQATFAGMHGNGRDAP
jgi:hypothetical protein